MTAALPAAMHALPAAISNAKLLGAKPHPTDFLDDLVRQGVAPGAALIASRNGEVIFQGAVGTYCSIHKREAPLLLETVHPLYSFSKIITGTVVAIAVTEGRLDYGDRVSKYIPEFQGGGKEDITIRHCLAHSAGLISVQTAGVRTPEDWNSSLELLCNATVDWEPGTRTGYHAWSGSFLAAECVRRVYANMPWAALCKEKLFDPLGTTSLSFDLPSGAANTAIVPQPPAAQPLPNSAEVGFGYAGHPGAGCFGTLPDVLAILHLHIKGGVWKSKTLISRQALDEMHRVQFSNEIEIARSAAKQPSHGSWGLGPLIRGSYPADYEHRWHGFFNQSSPEVFGHVGIGTILGVGDLESRVALVFATTHWVSPDDKLIELRNQITDTVFEALHSAKR